MSAKMAALLHRQIAGGDFEQAVKTVSNMAETKGMSFTDFIGLLQHAVNAGQPELAVALLDGNRRFFAGGGATPLRLLVGETTSVMASCWREKLDEPARKAVTLVLELLSLPDCLIEKEDIPIVAHFAGWAGRFALRQNDILWFGEIAMLTTGCAVRSKNEPDGEEFLSAFDFWLHRILRQGRVEAIPVVFEALSLFITVAPDKKKVVCAFLREWRVVAGMACLNVESPVASQLVEELLLFTVRSGADELWQPVSEKIGEIAVLAVTKHGVKSAFQVFCPLLDVGRVNLGDELKFGTGPDPDSKRQRIIRLVCIETLRIADTAAHTDMYAVSGDKIEEIFQCWVNDPQYASHIRSIQRFCQLLLIFWSNNRKRASKKWTPRIKSLSEPLLLTEEDRVKLVFLL